jgi:hypothetical protein
MIFSEYLLPLSLLPVPLGILPVLWESTHILLFCWTYGWGVLVCPWFILVEQVEVT